MRQIPPPQIQATSLAIAMFEGFHLESLGAFIDLAAASRRYIRQLLSENDEISEGIFNVFDVSLIGSTRTVLGSSEMPIQTQGSFLDDREYKLIVIPDMDILDLKSRDNIISPEAIGWLSHQYKAGATIAASGTAAVVLGKARLVRNLRLAVPWWLLPEFNERFPGAVVDSTSAIIEDRRIFSSAPGLDRALMIMLIMRLASVNAARWLARRATTDSYINNYHSLMNLIVGPNDALVSKAQAWLEQNYTRPVKISDLADKLNVSTRTLERHFLSALGIAPQAYLHNVRIGAARRLLALRAFKVTRVANLVGYSDVRFFRRLFEREVGMSPESYLQAQNDLVQVSKLHNISNS